MPRTSRASRSISGTFTWPEAVDRVILNVCSFDRDARRFYERLGFTPFQERMAFEIQSPDDRSSYTSIPDV